MEIKGGNSSNNKPPTPNTMAFSIVFYRMPLYLKLRKVSLFYHNWFGVISPS